MTLMVSGAIPFVALTLMMVMATPLPLSVSPAIALHLYGVVIASFVAGMHWGIHFCKRTKDNVYVHTSIIALVLWCSLLLAGTAAGFAVVLFGFLLLWFEEYRFSVQRVTTAWFWQTRNRVSAAVVLSLLIAIVLVL